LPLFAIEGSAVKTIHILAFRGIGVRNPDHARYPGLIRVGHVGIQFEDTRTIYGFHPTPQAVAGIGGAARAIEHLRARGTLMGTVQDDTAIFELARTLSDAYRRSKVWQITYDVGDVDYTSMYGRIIAWYENRTPFLYGFAGAVRASDNCATFLHRLGALPLPYGANQLEIYVRELRKRATLWEGIPV
jgi:hypothetical protein